MTTATGIAQASGRNSWLVSRSSRFCVLAALGLSLLPSSRVRAQSGPSIDISNHPPAMLSQSPAAAYQHDAVSRTARFRGTKTVVVTVYEEKTVTHTEPQIVYRTVREDRGQWQTRQRRGLLGTRTERVWVPNIVEVQVPEVVQVERKHVERIPHELKQEIVTTMVEPVVVHVRRLAPRPPSHPAETRPVLGQSEPFLR